MNRSKKYIYLCNRVDRVAGPPDRRWGEQEYRTNKFRVDKALFRACLVCHLKFFHPSHRIFRHMYGTLNVHKKIN